MCYLRKTGWYILNAAFKLCDNERKRICNLSANAWRIWGVHEGWKFPSTRNAIVHREEPQIKSSEQKTRGKREGQRRRPAKSSCRRTCPFLIHPRSWTTLSRKYNPFKRGGRCSLSWRSKELKSWWRVTKGGGQNLKLDILSRMTHGVLNSQWYIAPDPHKMGL